MERAKGDRSGFKNISIYQKKLGRGSQSTVDLNVLVQAPSIQTPDLGGFRNTNMGLVAVKNYYPDQYDDIDAGAIRELNIYYRLMGCRHIIQLLDVDILIINQRMLLKIMIPYHDSDLGQFIDKFPYSERLKYLKVIIDQLLNALLQLNIKGIIHRDIKPENILIDYNLDIDNNVLRSEPKVYLSDFGLSAQLPCERKFRHVQLSYQIGTPLYMAPELLGKYPYYNEKADIWGLGVTIISYLTGEIFTEPSKISYDLAYGIGIDAIIYETLNYLVEDHSFKSFKNLSFHDHVNIAKVFRAQGKFEDFNKIPKNITQLITKMLEIDPDDRLDIISLFPDYKTCQGSGKQLELGPTNVKLSNYYIILHKMLEISSDLKLDPRIFISSLNLFNKYIHTYDVETKNLSLVSASSL